MESKEQIKSLRALFNANPCAKVLLEDAAKRKNNSEETTVDSLVSRLNAEKKSVVSRSEVIEVLKKLEGLDFGKFKAGRHGHSSRFVWEVPITRVGKVAIGESESISTDVPIEGEAVSEAVIDERNGEKRFIRHRYQLRQGTEVSFELPSDLSAKEALRLAEFIRTLPFDDGSGA